MKSIFDQLINNFIDVEDEANLKQVVADWELNLATKPYFIFCYWGHGSDYGFGDTNDVRNCFGDKLSAWETESFDIRVFIIENGQVKDAHVEWDIAIKSIAAI